MSSSTGNRNRALRPLSAAAALFALFSCCTCGLDSFLFIDAPTVYQATDTYFIISKSGTDTTTKGYDIYYRFYQNSSDAVALDSKIQTSITKNETSLYSTIKSDYNYLSFMKYNDAKGDYSDTNVPFYMIPNEEIEANSDLRIRVDFSDKTHGLCAISRSGDGSPVGLPFWFNRRKSANNTDFETFDEISAGDIDLNAGTGSIAFMQLYVFAVGFEPSTLQSAYSMPIKIDMQFAIH